MFKTPAEYAKLMIDLHYGDTNAAFAEMFNAAREHSKVPAAFFADAAREVIKAALAGDARRVVAA